MGELTVTFTLPSSMVIFPRRAEMSELFPAPVGPTMATNSPARTRIFSLLRIGLLPLGSHVKLPFSMITE